MFRACGRMFVIADGQQLAKDLKNDMERLNDENTRVVEMNKSFEAKKEVLTAQLNALTPKEMKWSRNTMK